MTGLQKTFGRALVLSGALAFAYWGYLTLNQLWFQRAASHILKQKLSDANTATEQTASRLYATIPKLRPGEIIGHLDIPRINISVVVVEGADARILDVAAGHIPGTAFPGTIGNIGIAAHRDTFFRSLQEIRLNDTINLRTVGGIFNYRVEGTQVVDVTNVDVLHDTADSELTLVTCYPFRYIGAAPKRFIVHARQWN